MAPLEIFLTDGIEINLELEMARLQHACNKYVRGISASSVQEGLSQFQGLFFFYFFAGWGRI